MTISLREAIERATRFEELVPIASSLKSELSFFGTSYVVVDLTKPGAIPYTGDVSIPAISRRALEIIEETGRDSIETSIYTSEEIAVCHILAKQIGRLNQEDDHNRSRCSLITLIFRMFRWSTWDINREIYIWHINESGEKETWGIEKVRRVEIEWIPYVDLLAGRNYY